MKTKTSRRIVPTHPMLREIGFLAWVEDNARKQWLFPSYHEAKDPPDAAQKRMTYWMRTIGIHVKTVKTFHSLRHSAKAWLRQITDERIADLVQGHAMKTVGSKYSGRLTSDEIAQVMAGAPPKKVDFSPYREKVVLRQRPKRRYSGTQHRHGAENV